MQTNNMLDVREIEPRLRHSSIIQSFDKLNEGDVLTIINDQDALPLYYEFKSERPTIFDWDYIEKGPEIWMVSITKTGGELVTSVGDIVAENPRAAAVFKKYKIDYCCNGRKTLSQACEDAGIKTETLINEIKDYSAPSNISLRVQDWPLEILIEFIIVNHHQYIKNSAIEIKLLLDKLCKSHGQKDEVLLEIKKVFNEMCEELNAHMHKEEEVLFPAIKLIAAGEQRFFHFGTVRNPVSMMEMEHDDAGDQIHYIRKITKDYSVPEKACTSYKILMSLLEEFENDLQQHLHLENNVLFPKAIAMEKRNLPEFVD